MLSEFLIDFVCTYLLPHVFEELDDNLMNLNITKHNLDIYISPRIGGVSEGYVDKVLDMINNTMDNIYESHLWGLKAWGLKPDLTLLKVKVQLYCFRPYIIKYCDFRRILD